MKIFFYFITFLIIISYFFIINDTINYKDTQWVNNSPSIISLDKTSARICFSVTEPATIYWRLYTNKNQLPVTPHDFTNTNNLSKTIAFGGNISPGNHTSYTNNMTNLQPNKEYFLSAIIVNYIGKFPTKITNIIFKTI